MMLIAPQNQNAWIVYQEKLPEIQKLAQPLLDLGVKTFGYWKIFEDGTYVPTITNSSFMQTYFENVINHGKYYKEKLDAVPFGQTSYFLNGRIDSFIESQDPIVHMLWDYGLWNVMYLGFPQDNGEVNYFCFYMDRNNEQSIDFFLNNHAMLTKYCDFIQKKINTLYNFSDKSIRGHMDETYNLTPNDCHQKYKSALEMILTNEKKRNFSLKCGNEDIKLTYKEQECLSLLIEHKTVKEIARDMGISHRTVEVFIQNMRRKARVPSKSALIQMAARL